MCGFAHSTRTILPVTSTGCVASNTAENEWCECASALERPASNAAAATGNDFAFIVRSPSDSRSRLPAAAARPPVRLPAGRLGIGQVEQHRVDLLDDAVLDREELADEPVVRGRRAL